MLAYHLLRTVLYTLEQQGDTRPWPTLKRILQTHCYSTSILPTVDGTTRRIRRAGHPEAAHKAIYTELTIDWKHLPTNHQVIPAR